MCRRTEEERSECGHHGGRDHLLPEDPHEEEQQEEEGPDLGDTDSTGRLRPVEVPPFVRLSNDWRIVQKNIVVILNQFMRQITSTLRLSLSFFLFFLFCL